MDIRTKLGMFAFRVVTKSGRNKPTANQPDEGKKVNADSAVAPAFSARS